MSDDEGSTVPGGWNRFAATYNVLRLAQEACLVGSNLFERLVQDTIIQFNVTEGARQFRAEAAQEIEGMVGGSYGDDGA